MQAERALLDAGFEVIGVAAAAVLLLRASDWLADNAAIQQRAQSIIEAAITSIPNGPELRGYFEKLADGGTVIKPMETAGRGDAFGMCTDKFGTEWLVIIAGKHE